MCYLDMDIPPTGIGYAVGIGLEARQTTDGGHTWSDYLPGDTLNFHTYSYDGVHTLPNGNAVFTGWDGLIFYYDQFDSTKRQQLQTGTQERLEGIALPSQDTAINVGDFGTVLQTTDAGLTWNPINTPTFSYLYSVAFANNLVGVAAGNDGEILRTTDEGTTWTEVNNILTGTSVNIRGLQAFPDGTFLARAGSQLIRSTDFGQNWTSILPPGMSDTNGMNFYSPQIGIIAERPTTTANCPDTAHLAYTRDGGTTWNQFKVPIINYYRILFHWVNDHEVLMYGALGIIDDVDLSASGVQVTRVDNTSGLQVFPNPTSGNVRVNYTTKADGPVSIQLISEDGKDMGTLFSGTEQSGAHEQQLALPTHTAGTYFIKVSADGASSVASVTIQ